MRVLTKREREAFNAAWMFMERVGGMYAGLGTPERSVHQIKVKKRDEISQLPPKVIKLVDRLGGLAETNMFFNGVAKELNFEVFVADLMSRKEQPKDYWADGVLVYDDVYVETIEYRSEQ